VVRHEPLPAMVQLLPGHTRRCFDLRSFMILLLDAGDIAVSPDVLLSTSKQPLSGE
jgi:hypothetical protein